MIEELHRKNPNLEWAKHELIWSMMGKYRIYIRISEKGIEFIPFTDILDSFGMVKLLTFIQHKFRDFYFYEKRGIFESLYLIEKEINTEIL